MTSVPMSPPRTFVGFDPQRVLPGFEHVRRFWDPAQDCVTVKIALPPSITVGASAIESVGGVSLSLIVPVAVPVTMVALTGLLSVTVKS